MASTSDHSSKSVRLSDNKQAPAKLWELLRRNDRFRMILARFTELGREAQSHNQEEARHASERAERIVDALDRVNGFAADALRWLVPCPLFLRREIAVPRDCDAAKRVVAPETIRLGWGITPDPSESEPWHWFESLPPTGNEQTDSQRSAESQANWAGWPMRWGPEIETVTTADLRLKRACCDEISEWSGWFAKHHFTVDMPWDQAPPGFQRTFCHHWSRLPGGSHQGEETDFFQSWDLGRTLTHAHHVVNAANRCIKALVSDLDRVRKGEPETVCPPVPTKEGRFTMRQVPEFILSLDEQELARIIQFTGHARQRVFSIPRPLTRSDALTIFEKLGKALASELPDPHQLLGTPEFWCDFEQVEAIECQEGVDTGEAIRRYIYREKGTPRVVRETRQHLSVEKLRRWFRDGFLLPRPKVRNREFYDWKEVHDQVAPLLLEVNLAYRTTVKTRVAYMRDLIAATFPRLDFDTLTRLPTHKRKRPK